MSQKIWYNSLACYRSFPLFNYYSVTCNNFVMRRNTTNQYKRDNDSEVTLSMFTQDTVSIGHLRNIIIQLIYIFFIGTVIICLLNLLCTLFFLYHGWATNCMYYIVKQFDHYNCYCKGLVYTSSVTPFPHPQVSVAFRLHNSETSTVCHVPQTLNVMISQTRLHL